jgi:hypothetical protein
MLVKKCLFPIDAYVVSCPTYTKNLRGSLIKKLYFAGWSSWYVVYSTVHIHCNDFIGTLSTDSIGKNFVILIQRLCLINLWEKCLQ